jgi:hypothetical protein
MANQIFRTTLLKLQVTLESYIEENEGDDQSSIDFVKPYLQLKEELSVIREATIDFKLNTTKDQICMAILRSCPSLNFSTRANKGIQIARMAKFDVL